MTIRAKTLVLVVSTLLVSAAILYLILSALLLKSYSELEMESANRDMRRLQKVFSSDLKKLLTDTEDWASWDDTYTFTQDKNQEYISSNLRQSTPSDLGLDFIK